MQKHPHLRSFNLYRGAIDMSPEFSATVAETQQNLAQVALAEQLAYVPIQNPVSLVLAAKDLDRALFRSHRLRGSDLTQQELEDQLRSAAWNQNARAQTLHEPKLNAMPDNLGVRVGLHLESKELIDERIGVYRKMSEIAGFSIESFRAVLYFGSVSMNGRTLDKDTVNVFKGAFESFATKSQPVTLGRSAIFRKYKLPPNLYAGR